MVVNTTAAPRITTSPPTSTLAAGRESGPPAVELVKSDESLDNVHAIDLTPFAKFGNNDNKSDSSTTKAGPSASWPPTTAPPAKNNQTTVPTIKPSDTAQERLKTFLKKADDFIGKSFKSIKQMF